MMRKSGGPGGSWYRVARRSVLAMVLVGGLASREAMSAQKAPSGLVPAVRLEHLPAAAILIDESSRDVFVLPPESARVTPGLQVKPGVFFSGRLLDSEKANETTTSLAERSGLLVAQAQKRLGSLRFDSAWGKDVLDFLAQAGGFAQGLGLAKGVWPLPVPFAESSLKGRSGLLLVFTCRNADRSGILDKLDWVAFDGGRVVRSYWSRGLNDPTASEKVAGAIEKLASHFARSLKGGLPPARENVVRFAVDKKVSEKELVALENVLKGFVGAGTDPLLVPYEVNRSDIRYQSPLEVEKIDAFVEKLKAVAPLVTVRKVSSEAGIVQIMSGPVPQEH